MNRPRDSKGRFIKATQPEESKVMVEESVRDFNRVAEHGEPTEEKQHQQDILVDFLQNVVGAIVFFIIAALILVAFCGCTPQEKVNTVYVPVIRTVNVETVIHDTVIQAPLEQSHQERVTNDTTSTLSNKYSTSTATVSDGVLAHTLDTRPDAVVDVPVQYVDRIITKVDSVSYPVEVERIVEVERELTFFQQLLMWVGGLTLGVLALWDAWKVLKNRLTA